jgi:hypothetical protein
MASGLQDLGCRLILGSPGDMTESDSGHGHSLEIVVRGGGFGVVVGGFLSVVAGRVDS